MQVARHASSHAENSSNGGQSLVKHRRFLVSPILHLTGHEAAVLSCQFSPNGNQLASTGMDRHVLLWNTVDGTNTLALNNIHKNAITDLKWSNSGSLLYTCSADMTVAVYDVEKLEISRRFRDHTGIVNALAVNRSDKSLLASCADDNFICVYDTRSMEKIAELETKYPVLSVAFDGTNLYSGGIENDISIWDMRTMSIESRLVGHRDGITGMAISPDGSSLLTSSMDNTCKIWDIKPFSSIPNRLIGELLGAPHGYDKNLIKPCWNSDGTLVSCGSGDHTVLVWDVQEFRVKFKLPGHKGTVNQVDFHPSESILASCSNDSSLFVGDLTYTTISAQE